MTFQTVQADCDRLHKFCHESKEPVLILDLSDLSHCDSAGLALLIEAKRICSLKNKICKITGMPKVILALAEFCGVDEILGVDEKVL
ncbi:MAG: STAS domain-containing protein [Tatlockia sp.]|nr:STAS domain-containing protein [Tatlockia sp.]